MMSRPIPACLLLPLILSACISGPIEPDHLPTAEPARVSHRLTATETAPDSLEQGRLSRETLEHEKQRLDRIGRAALGVDDPDAPHQVELTRILFDPHPRQWLEYRERFRGIPLLATPVRLLVEGGRVVRVEGSLHPLPDDFDTKARIDTESAIELARIYVSAPPNAASTAEQVIFFDEEALPRLAWQVLLPRQKVWIDALEGRMLDQERR